MSKNVICIVTGPGKLAPSYVTVRLRSLASRASHMTLFATL